MLTKLNILNWLFEGDYGGYEHPSDSSTDGVSDYDIGSWDSTDASDNWSPSDEGAEADCSAPIGLERYFAMQNILMGQAGYVLMTNKGNKGGQHKIRGTQDRQRRTNLVNLLKIILPKPKVNNSNKKN
jgi:hypothetical protein